MNRRKMIFRAGAIVLWVCFLISPAMPAADSNAAKPKKVLFFSKSSGFEHSVIKHTGGNPSHAEKVLLELAPKHNIEFTFSKDGSLFTPEYLAGFDAYMFYTTGDLTTPGTDKQPPMSAEGKAAFLQAIKNGKGFIGTHSATDTFHSPGNEKPGAARYQNDGDSVDPYIAMIGGEFIMHGAQQKSRMIGVNPKFPGMSAVTEDFGPLEEWYSLKDFAPNLHVLLVQDTFGMKGNMYQRPPYPATWARMYGQGRVFYTNMGHREDIWTNPVFQNVLMGGVHWAVRDVEADVTPNIGKTAPKASEMPPEK
jgi:type 1 glutamine amidotransferase